MDTLGVVGLILGSIALGIYIGAFLSGYFKK